MQSHVGEVWGIGGGNRYDEVPDSIARRRFGALRSERSSIRGFRHIIVIEWEKLIYPIDDR